MEAGVYIKSLFLEDVNNSENQTDEVYTVLMLMMRNANKINEAAIEIDKGTKTDKEIEEEEYEKMTDREKEKKLNEKNFYQSCNELLDQISSLLKNVSFI